MKKGYAYLIDALFAIIIFGIMLSASVSLNEPKDVKNIEQYQLREIGNDVMTALDEKRVLSSYSESLLKDALESIIPENMEWQLDINRYVHNGKQFSASTSKTIYQGIGRDEMLDVNYDVKVKRVFFGVENRELTYYFVGELKLRAK